MPRDRLQRAFAAIESSIHRARHLVQLLIFSYSVVVHFVCRKNGAIVGGGGSCIKG